MQTMPGFVAILSAKDIPPGGVNSIASMRLFPLPEEVSYSIFNQSH